MQSCTSRLAPTNPK